MEATLIDSMGSDLTVVNAARVSFNRESDWEDGYEHSDGRFTGELSDKDQRLIKYLAKHNHWTPFSHVQITMREKVPIFVARQRFKHVVGFTYNEVSRRYVDDAPEFFVPKVWRKAAENKKQGSSREEAFVDMADITDWNNDAFTLYKHLIENCNVAPEQARMVLPQSMYTEYYVTGSLAAWARAYNQRSEEHAQIEIQELAKQWDNIIRNIPELKYSWEALSGKET